MEKSRRTRISSHPVRSLRWLAILTFSFVVFLKVALSADANYEKELRGQIEGVKHSCPEGFCISYYYDMGILARKADEVDLTLLTTEIVKSLLLDRMDKDIMGEIEQIKALYRTDRYEATKRLKILNQFESFYQPTDEYLRTTGGQTLKGILSNVRRNALLMFERGCSEVAIRNGIQAVRKTGLFRANYPEEIVSLRELTAHLDCCLNWKPQFQFVMKKPFESDYEKGTLSEEVNLRLRSSRQDMSEAQWAGRWIYRIEGREGRAEGVSQATLRYRKGEETADLVISASRVSSVGRINFPLSLSGDHRTLEVEGGDFYPSVTFSEDTSLDLLGCRGG
jgi:hypothetical protein